MKLIFYISAVRAGAMKNYRNLTRKQLIALVRELTEKQAPMRRMPHDRLEFPAFGEREQQDFEKSPHAIRIFDRENLRYLAVNDAALGLYGYSREEFLKLTPLDTRHRDEAHDFRATLPEPTGYLRFRGPRRHVTKDGRIIIVEIVTQDIEFNGRPARLSLTRDLTEQMRTQALLPRREREFSALAENAPDIIARLDRHLRHLYINRAVTDATGLPPQAFLGKTNRELGFPPHLVALWEDCVNGVFASGQARTIEFAGPSPSEERHFEARVVPEFIAENGEVTTVLSIARDITERKRAEEALKQRGQQFESLAENLPDLVARFDRDLRYVYVNAAIERLTGRARGEILGKTQRQLGMPEDIVTAFEKSVRDAFATGDSHSIEFRYPGVESERLFEALHAPERDSKGETKTVLCVARDITERKHSEAALRDSERRFRQLAENTRDVFWIASPALDRMIYVSPAFEEIWGMAGARLYHNPRVWLEAVHPEDRSRLERETGRLAAGQPVILEYRIVRPDGAIRWIRHRCYHTAPSDGLPLMYGVAEDITERKRQERENIARLLRQRDALIREVHHRIKNNLQGVVGLLRLLASEHPEAATLVGKSILQLQAVAVVHGLQAREPGNATPLRDMVRAIAQAAEEALRVAVRLDIDVGTAVQLAEGETVPVALVLNELVNNAAKSARCEDGAALVQVGLRAHADWAEVVVSNRGRLPAGFDFGAGRRLGTGLELVRSLVPSEGAKLRFSQTDNRVEVLLQLSSPVIMPPARALQDSDSRIDQVVKEQG
jgi:PAS domain S-box-containing protein